MKIKKHISNFITSLNLLTGSVGVYFAFSGNYTVAFFAVLIAGLFDFLDGLTARILKAYSPMGKELDSLADVISFGLLPATVVFSMLASSTYPDWTQYIGLLIVVFSALRLAKFNIDENQTDSFIGLSTPANAIFWTGMAYSCAPWLIDTTWLVIVLTIVFSGLLVSKFPMFALKFRNLKWADNKIQYIFLFGCIVLLLLMGWNGFAPIIGWYILASATIYPFLK